jgi:hypothetical protein
MSTMRSARLLSALPIILSVLGSACGDSDGQGGSGGSNATSSGGSPPATGGGGGGVGGDGGCTEITVELAFVVYDPAGGPTTLAGESSPSGDPERDSFELSLFPDEEGAYETGAVPLGMGDNANYATCRTCLLVYEDMLNTRTYLATEGTATVDPLSAPGSARVELVDVTLAEVEIDEATSQSSLVPGGRCLHLVAAGLDGLSEPELCDDDVDNDNDDLIDCSDDDCSSTSACEAELQQACAAATPLEAGTPISASSGEGSRVLTYDACETGNFTGGGPEQIYLLTPTESGLAKLRLDTDVDMGVYVRTSCTDAITTIECSDAWPEFVPEWLNIPVQAGVPLYVVVDSYSESAADGGYLLQGTVDPVVAGDRCDTAPTLPASETREYADLGPDVVLGPAAAAACTNGTIGRGAEAVYEVVLAAGQTVEVTVTPTGYADPVLYLSDACSAVIDTCLAGADAGSYGEPETLTFTSAAGGTYSFFVDSSSSAALQFGYSLASTVE